MSSDRCARWGRHAKCAGLGVLRTGLRTTGVERCSNAWHLKSHVLTCSLVFEVVFDVVRFQPVQVGALLWRAVVQVVVDHVIDHVSTQTPHEQGGSQTLRQRLPEYQVKSANDNGGQTRRKHQTRAVERRLTGKKRQVELHQYPMNYVNSSTQWMIIESQVSN